MTRLTILFATLLVALIATSSAVSGATELPTTLPDASTLPPNVIRVSPSIPMMGEHWADPATLPLGPIYCVHEGKIVCLEYMISQEEFASGKSWKNLAGRTDLPSVNHISINFEPNGHEGFAVPHYDMHIYFITPDQVAQIK